MNKLVISLRAVFMFATLAALAFAQQPGSAPAPPNPSSADYSGMYSFLQDGEFVQVTVEDQGRLTGFVSRYGDLESDRGAFLDHFFKNGKLDGNRLAFTTETVHGVWFDFKGVLERGAGKNPGDENYYVIRGSLTQYTISNDKTSTRTREVAFKSFPRDMVPAPRKHD
ncbi:MAG TPA: hypothetical protein VFA89_04270 [Terriglobales bacterium]|nr:hypothetical protein [Terriglobales bacterium]